MAEKKFWREENNMEKKIMGEYKKQLKKQST
jgi:hypothetical protein